MLPIIRHQRLNFGVIMVWRFIRAYIKSMRLYYAFITGIAGWIGIAFYYYVMPLQFNWPRAVTIVVLLFLGWGINQIVNDYFGLPEDRINAPHRPMVTGELNPKLALYLSMFLIFGLIIFSYFLNPWSIIPVVLGVLLNVLYEYAKAWSLWGNIIFGLSISMCTIYGFLAAGPLPKIVFTSDRWCVIFLVALLNGLMTFYTYFKDYQGDLIAGKRTFVVKYGIDIARYAGMVGAFLPTLFFLIFLYLNWLPLYDILHLNEFIFCGVITIFLQIWTAALFFKYPAGEQTYYSLATNIRACVAGQVTLIAIFNGILALYLLSASYVFIGFLFNQYKDARS